ncbi:hypothetical protein K1T71_011529 [Dendrolimus kikuchii]|uniref:Uncharacterized protein n=1 Tax=Dendrolimus kikuchii TaxID=765133 RepID=A0ACC1CP99_9NEOP|nr:hypothetical protein K1T71_011529 [Dendrolimus kikuchii]
MSKTLKNPQINPNERLSKHSKHCSSINGKTFTKTVIPKRILISRKISKNFHDGKSCSAGVINKTEKHLVKPKKTTKSEVSFPRIKDDASDDYCKNCGDYLKHHNDDSSTNIIDAPDFHIPTLINSINSKIAKNDRRKSIQQYYKNENFNYSTNSIIENNDHLKKTPLDTIKEDSEMKFKTEDIFEIYTDSDSSNGLDLDKEDNVRQIKEFRQNNYFECHSTKSRLKTKGSVTSLQDHKCVYRFYLNDRLFPVPFATRVSVWDSPDRGWH